MHAHCLPTPRRLRNICAHSKTNVTCRLDLQRLRNILQSFLVPLRLHGSCLPWAMLLIQQQPRDRKELKGSLHPRPRGCPASLNPGSPLGSSEWDLVISPCDQHTFPLLNINHSEKHICLENVQGLSVFSGGWAFHCSPKALQFVLDVLGTFHQQRNDWDCGMHRLFC